MCTRRNFFQFLCVFEKERDQKDKQADISHPLIHLLILTTTKLELGQNREPGIRPFLLCGWQGPNILAVTYCPSRCTLPENREKNLDSNPDPDIIVLSSTILTAVLNAFHFLSFSFFNTHFYFKDIFFTQTEGKQRERKIFHPHMHSPIVTTITTEMI